MDLIKKKRAIDVSKNEYHFCFLKSLIQKLRISFGLYFAYIHIHKLDKNL